VADDRLLLLCERDAFAPVQQAVSAAAAALAQGARVDLVLFHGALARLLDQRLDVIEGGLAHADSYREALESGRVALVTDLLASARERGLGLYACSASVALLGYSPGDVLGPVDEVVGWPTILGWMSRADRVLAL
jgi:peroxiredoxin family protein